MLHQHLLWLGLTEDQQRIYSDYMNINELPEDVLAQILRISIDKKPDNMANIEPVCPEWRDLVNKYCLWKEIAGTRVDFEPRMMRKNCVFEVENKKRRCKICTTNSFNCEFSQILISHFLRTKFHRTFPTEYIDKL